MLIPGGCHLEPSNGQRAARSALQRDATVLQSALLLQPLFTGSELKSDPSILILSRVLRDSSQVGGKIKAR
jgi:hypothetical protein